MKVGDTGYIKLEEFDPPWRQALILLVKKQGKKLYLAVRVLESELVERWKEVSFFQCAGQKFLLVEGDPSRVKNACRMAHRALETDIEGLLASAKPVLEKEDLQFATASEELEPDPPSTKKGQKIHSESESESSEGSGGSQDAIFNLLSRARKQRPDLGISFDAGEKKEGKKKKKGRYAMLETNKASRATSSSTPPIDNLLAQTLAAGDPAAAGSQLNALVQVEILKALQGRKKERSQKSLQEDTSESASSSNEDSSQDEKQKLRGAGKAMRAYRRTRKVMRKNPTRHIRRYIREVEEGLGVTSQTPYQLTDWTKRLSWGKFRTLMRCHYAISDTLQLLLNGKDQLAALQLVQLLRALHQCSIDQGDWRTAWLMLHMPDPVERPRFGGEPQDLEVIASYVRAMADLERKGKAAPTPKPTEGDPPVGGGKGKKSKGKKAGQTNQAEEVPEG